MVCDNYICDLCALGSSEKNEKIDRSTLRATLPHFSSITRRRFFFLEFFASRFFFLYGTRQFITGSGKFLGTQWRPRVLLIQMLIEIDRCKMQLGFRISPFR